MTELIEKRLPAEPETLSDVYGHRWCRTRRRLLGLSICVCGWRAGTCTAATALITGRPAGYKRQATVHFAALFLPAGKLV